jgi:hypothetical protein
MLQTDAFDADTAAMLRQIYDEVCAQYVSLAPDEQGMRETIAAAIEGIARNGQRKRERILRYARFKTAERFSAPPT